APRIPMRAKADAPRPVSWAPLALGFIGLVAAPAWDYATERAATGPVPKLETPAPAGFDGPEAAGWSWQPSFPGAAAERHVAFRRGDDVVDAYLAFYNRQRSGRKLIGYYSRLEGMAQAGEPALQQRSLAVRVLPAGEQVEER